jgi:hypothetical protein
MNAKALDCLPWMRYIDSSPMRIPTVIAGILLFCTLGSLLWCADLCIGSSGIADEDCTCLLGGLLAGDAPGTGHAVPSSPLTQSHESCRCLCQGASLPAVSYLLSLCTTFYSVTPFEQTVTLPHFSKDILHPPRVA